MYTKYQLGFPWNQNHQKLHKNSKKKKKKGGEGGGGGGGEDLPSPPH